MPSPCSVTVLFLRRLSACCWQCTAYDPLSKTGRAGYAIAGRHKLRPHLGRDIRAETGTQGFVAKVPLNLVYVAHSERMDDISAEDRRLHTSVDTGFIGQNVYMFRASEGLATVFRAALDSAWSRPNILVWSS